MKFTSLITIVVIAVAFISHAPATPLRIDGLFDDWAEVAVVATDPADDATGAFDLTQVSAMSRGSVLYLHFDTGRVLNIQKGPGNEGTLLVELGLPGEHELTIDTRGRRAFLDGRRGDAIPWSELGYVSGPTYASDEFEMRVDLTAYGVRPGSTVNIQFSGSDTLDSPATFRLVKPGEEPDCRSPDRAPDTDVRIACLNTYASGLVDPKRSAAMGRLLRAAKADVYCFQEEHGSESRQAALAKLMPGDAASPWNVHRDGDCVVASRLPLKPLPSHSKRSAAAVVEFPDGRAIVVFSIHPKCCGYIDSEQDQGRIGQMKVVVQAIEDLRQGKFGSEFEPYRHVGIVVIGDYNLVGSRTPLDMLTDAAGPGLQHWLLPNLIGESVATWRQNDSSFPPGLLDLVTYSPGRLVPRNGFVLDTGHLNEEELAKLGVKVKDSLVSDHLMLLADFAISEPD